MVHDGYASPSVNSGLTTVNFGLTAGNFWIQGSRGLSVNTGQDRHASPSGVGLGSVQVLIEAYST